MQEAPTEIDGVVLDYTQDSLFDQLGLQRLRESYMTSDEVSPQERFAKVSKQFSSNPDHAQRLYDYASKHWLSYSTPILSHGRNKKGLSVSCYLSFLPDSSDGLVDTYKETCILSMLGGGVGVGVGLRTSDDKSTGVLAHMKTYDSASMAYKQGSTRRGSFAMYLDISHPEIIPFLEMRKPTGDANTRCTNLNHAVNIPDAFMHIIERCMKDSNANDDWQLIDPFSKEVTKVVSAKALWSQLLKLRKETGEPYFLFIDTANKKLPHWQKKLGLKIRQSNLCLVGDTIITIRVDGVIQDIRLDDFISKFELGYYTNVEAYSYNTDADQPVWSPITNAALTAEVSELYEIETPGGKIIKCTPEHKIYTSNRGYIRACDLVGTDTLLEI